MRKLANPRMAPAPLLPRRRVGSSHPGAHQTREREWRESPPSILVGIEFPRAGHCDRERPQRVENSDRASMRPEHVGEPAICHGTLIDVAAAKKDLLFP